jgi:hypothetical protein
MVFPEIQRTKCKPLQIYIFHRGKGTGFTYLDPTVTFFAFFARAYSGLLVAGFSLAANPDFPSAPLSGILVWLPCAAFG